ncbi:MAG: hypothetical protein MOGMAGMI_00288 [Candidatus Omnitrophica bacterium]|nr:hypothetical protein [Candidatus Omnitrophota bacterium]
MLFGQVLNSDATLNNFKVLGSKSFIPGETITLVIRIINSENNLRYIPPSAAIKTLIFNKKDGTELVIDDADITSFADDRSILSTIISDTDSEDLMGGTFKFILDINGDGTVIYKGLIEGGLELTLEGNSAC